VASRLRVALESSDPPSCIAALSSKFLLETRRPAAPGMAKEVAMKVRNAAVAAIIAASALAPRGAFAQGGTPAAPPAPVHVPTADEIIFRPATVLGEAWAQALQAVLDGMKRLVDERIEARETLAPTLSPVSPCRGTACVATPVPAVPRMHAGWLPAGGWREAYEKSPVQLTPVAVTPPTESPRDTRGEQGVVLGAKVLLPWMVP
jgi:hypothetical protein